MANSAIVGILRALLVADTAQFQAGLKGAASEARAWQKDLASIGRQATEVGRTLTASLTLPILGVGAASAKAFVDFEDSFAGVRKTVDASEPEFAALAQGFRDLAKTIPVNVNELNRLGETAGALGIAKEDIVDFTRVMAMLGVTTNVTSEQAAESIAKIQNIFGAAGKDTERFASTLVALGNDGASTEQEILALATRIASAANTARMSQSEVLGFSAAIANVGMEAEAGGSAFSRVLNDISMAVSNGGKDLQSFAGIAKMSAADFATAFREDAAGAMVAFLTGLGDVRASGGDLNRVITELGFTELRQSDLLRRLAGDSAGLEKAMHLQGAAWRDMSALSTEAGERFKTFKSQMQLVWNNLRDVGITIGLSLVPAMQSALGVLRALMPYVQGAAEWFGKLPGPVQATALAALGLVAAAGPLLFLFGQMSIGAASLIGLFTRKGLVMRALGVDATAAAVATGNLSVAQGALAASSSVVAVAIGSMTAATNFWSGSALVMGARMAATTAATTLSTAATGAWTAAMNLLGASSIGLGARMAATTLTAGAFSVSAGAATTATIALGTALTGLLWVVTPLAVAWAGWEVGGKIGDWTGLTDVIGRASARFGEWVGYLPKGTAAAYDASVANAKMIQSMRGVADASAEAAKRLREDISGEYIANEVHKLKVAFASLTPEQQKSAFEMKRVGQLASQLREQGGRLHPELKVLADAFDKTQRAALGLGGALPATTDAIQEQKNKILGIITVTKEWKAAMDALGRDWKTERWDLPGVSMTQSFQEAERSLWEMYQTLDKLTPKWKDAQSFTQSIEDAEAAMRRLLAIQPTGAWKDAGSFTVDPEEAEAGFARVEQALIDMGVAAERAKAIAAQAAQDASHSFSAHFSRGLENLPSVIVGAIQGGGNAIQAATASLGASVAGWLTERIKKDMPGLMGSLLAGLAGTGVTLLSGLVGNLFAGNDTKKAREAFASEMGLSLDGLYKRLQSFGPEGQRLAHEALNLIGKKDTAANQAWIASVQALIDKQKELNDALADGTPEGARGFPTKAQLDKAAKDAEAAYIYMRDSGLYTADVLEQAWQKWQDALIASGDAGSIAMQKMREQMSALDQEYADLSKAVAQEAWEEEEGVIEKQQRARLAVIEEEKKALAAKMAEEEQLAESQAEAAGRKILGIAEVVHKGITDLFTQTLRIPIEFAVSGMGAIGGGITRPDIRVPGYRTGTRGEYVDFGAGTLAMLHGRERVVPEGEMLGGGGSFTAHIENIVRLSDGRELARAIAPELVFELKQMGVFG